MRRNISVKDMPMETYKIDELMVPLSEYATVDEDATLLEKRPHDGQ